ncbi:SDR family NAD(P)-dependent oxidoreductase [Aspergillus clavatus NRRL 1]|uniref:Short chain dehydrogenase/reductase family n=1 Tax=Aspergillus clavatus (strain ATCC 1007 / CBS 513.65 / DSM 816 / NCTC 3887 / NRRL 1 / QM 1276 / 107) TaxID=344612 RepID=A1CBJ4_ASPCL|nr:short chain dehydrogenase/reductase family [Aspergillus clavatus NRRL 1]EAW13112.1 short chain dehydrogenase/reductase family [Aspergillus clavatus NRRL 1]
MSNLQASQLFSVKGAVVVVTGAGSGLGRTMALALDANGASKVFIVGRREDKLQETAFLAVNNSIIPIKGDVSSKESLQAAYEAIASQTGHINLLIANSGVMGPEIKPPAAKEDGSLPSLTEIRDKLWSVPMEEFSRIFDINVTGAYYTVLAFLPLLEAANKQRPAPEMNKLSAPTAQVVITSSIAGHIRQVPFSYAYSLSKSATTHLVKMLSTTLSSYDIRVNGIAPGLYFSEMSAESFSGGNRGVSDGSFPRERIPLTRGGSDEDIAGLILWLASASGGYMNGSIVVTDGGRTAVHPAVY